MWKDCQSLKVHNEAPYSFSGTGEPPNRASPWGRGTSHLTRPLDATTTTTAREQAVAGGQEGVTWPLCTQGKLRLQMLAILEDQNRNGLSRKYFPLCSHAGDQGSLSKPSPKAQCSKLPLSNCKVYQQEHQDGICWFLSNKTQKEGKKGTELLAIKSHRILKIKEAVWARWETKYFHPRKDEC